MAEAYIVDAVRTPRGIGKPGKGALAKLHPQHLAATVLKALSERNNLKTAEIDDIISVPPAITRSSIPAMIWAAPRFTVVMPEPQKRLRVTPEARTS